MIRRPKAGKKILKSRKVKAKKTGLAPTKFLRKFNLNTLPDSARELPVTAQMLYEVRDELLFSIRAVSVRVDSFEVRFEAIDKKFEAIDARFEAIDKRFDAIDKKFDIFRDEMHALMHRNFLKMEEQSHQNRIAFEALTGMISRQDRMEKRLDDHIEQCTLSVAESLGHSR